MNYNIELIGDILDITDESGVYEYPVSIEEVKHYLRVEGFVDENESTFEDDFDDALIAGDIKSSFQYFEQTCWLSLRPKQIKWMFTNLCGNVQLPYGPHGDVIELLDCEDEVISSDDYKLTGLVFKKMKYPCNANMTISMNVGYGTTGLPELPEPIKKDIIRLCAYIYENRGEDQSIAKFSSQLASVYSRKPAVF